MVKGDQGTLLDEVGHLGHPLVGVFTTAAALAGTLQDFAAAML